ncbi:MAG: hypothetical protein Q8R25_04825 [bacterium]|nr:hypothetical protein [bacterium]
MTTDALIILAGALVAVLPFLGFPNSWDTVFFFLLGIFVVALGIVVRRKQVAQRPRVTPTHFTESLPVSADASDAPHHEKLAQ